MSIECTDLKALLLKTVLLMALTSPNRMNELHALSVHASCLAFSLGNRKVVLILNLAFVLDQGSISQMLFAEAAGLSYSPIHR